ncbi:hypothetical protein B0H19DRAFT_1256509 [Mycena capillaripes]|nr:hypothetical protein B0H19DRAFT_1256509 [Mycena capillaripes]
MIPEIPQELIDAVIDCLTDSTDLSRCALVSHSWLPCAQSSIFCTISLGVGLQGGLARGLIELPPLGTDLDNFNNFAVLHDLLQRSPHLALYIRTLNLGLPPMQSELEAERDLLLSSDSWKKIEDLVVDLIPLLQRLKSLGLFPCGHNVIPSTWNPAFLMHSELYLSGFLHFLDGLFPIPRPSLYSELRHQIVYGSSSAIYKCPLLRCTCLAVMWLLSNFIVVKAWRSSLSIGLESLSSI